MPLPLVTAAMRLALAEVKILVHWREGALRVTQLTPLLLLFQRKPPWSEAYRVLQSTEQDTPVHAVEMEGAVEMAFHVDPPSVDRNIALGLSAVATHVLPSREEPMPFQLFRGAREIAFHVAP